MYLLSFELRDIQRPAALYRRPVVMDHPLSQTRATPQKLAHLQAKHLNDFPGAPRCVYAIVCLESRRDPASTRFCLAKS